MYPSGPCFTSLGLPKSSAIFDLEITLLFLIPILSMYLKTRAPASKLPFQSGYMSLEINSNELGAIDGSQ